MRRIYLLIAIAMMPLLSLSQITQSVRGRVIDAVSQRTLPGASVVLVDTTQTIGTSTDLDGTFKLENIPIGRISLKVSFIGYQDRIFENLVLSPSKQMVMEVALTERINKVDEVVIKAKKDVTRPNNEMALVSTRTFSVEETRRFAGSWQDPARAAAAFAGVSGGTDERNDIIIRGNSPTAVLWRLEDINIPNPNHLSFSGSTGGPVSILNNNMLANSDFYTGAFPAEYGNANAGAFDLKLRRGNNEQREYYFQLGLNGVEFGLEGPFSKKHRASYLASYRYSTMALISLMGINLGVAAVPQFQDLTFVVDVPTGSKAGKFTAWGIGGISSINISDNPGFNSAVVEKRDQRLGSDMGVFGLSHLLFLGERTTLKSSVAISGLNQWHNKHLIETTDSSERKYLQYFNKSETGSLNSHIRFNTKFNARTSLRTGVLYDHRFISFVDSSLIENTENYLVRLNLKENYGVAQIYAQVHHRFTEDLSGTIGVHGQGSTLNTSFAIEPRVGFNYRAHSRHNFSFGAGMHSQMQPALTYFHQTYLPAENRYALTNSDVGLSRSVHGVLGYDFTIFPKLRLKLETYYQYLYNIPVEPTPTYFSMVNAGESIGDVQVSDSLVNEGTGKNMGLELTIEKFFSKGYYFLVSGSVYDSKYRGSDGKLRNTAFNGQYNMTALGGYELRIGPKNRLSFDTKITWTAGNRFVPIDLETSKLLGETVRNESRAYEEKYKDYFRTDIKVSYIFNGRKASHSLAFDFQNVFNTKNVFNQFYDPSTGEIETKHQLGFLPLLYYRVEF